MTGDGGARGETLLLIASISASGKLRTASNIRGLKRTRRPIW